MEVLGRAQLHRVLKQPQPQLQLRTLIYLKRFSFKCVQITKKSVGSQPHAFQLTALAPVKKKLEIQISLNNIIETESTFFSHRVCGLGLMYVTILFTILFINLHNAIFSNTILTTPECEKDTIPTQSTPYVGNVQVSTLLRKLRSIPLIICLP